MTSSDNHAAPDDGGPAFPTFANNAHGGLDAVGSGMSLRDWFAGQALAGLGDWTPLEEDLNHPDWTSLRAIRRRRAEWAYAQADAMLATRKQGGA